MNDFLRRVYASEAYFPTWYLGVWLNPFFIVRRRLLAAVRKIALQFRGGKLLDVGCGSKPYEGLFDVDRYIGVDVAVSGHAHTASKIDHYYDGKKLPFADAEFDWVFSSEVFEHVFNLDELLGEISRVLKQGGRIGFTCPFVWDEHEQPYDFARYTSFAVRDLMSRHGFEVESLDKTSAYFETVMQMLAAYVFQHVLPGNVLLRLLLTPILVTPITVIGVVGGYVLPGNQDFYLGNVVIAKKL